MNKGPKNRQLLESYLRAFPRSPISFDDYHHNNVFRIALILYLSGAESVEMGFGYLSGDKTKIENILPHKNSLIVKPYLHSSEVGTNLLWYLLKKLKIGYSGGAGKNNPSYMQASWMDKENFILELIALFQIFQKNGLQFKN
jgi:hypothetical protein